MTIVSFPVMQKNFCFLLTLLENYWIANSTLLPNLSWRTKEKNKQKSLSFFFEKAVLFLVKSFFPLMFSFFYGKHSDRFIFHELLTEMPKRHAEN